jgi:hypothetical protein
LLLLTGALRNPLLVRWLVWRGEAMRWRLSLRAGEGNRRNYAISPGSWPTNSRSPPFAPYIASTAVDRNGWFVAGLTRYMAMTAPRWENEIRIDDRDKISISDSRHGGHQTRITRMALVALGCIAALSSYYFLGQSLVSEQKVNFGS